MVASLLWGCSGDKDTNSGPAPQAGTTTTDDADGDGVTVDQDCDDDDASVGGPQEWYIDNDSDGYGVQSASTAFTCDPQPGMVDNSDDCNDSNGQVHPGAAELCDGEDNDCDGVPDSPNPIDGTRMCFDGDNDGFGDPDECLQACASLAGYADNDDDCDDADPTTGAASNSNDDHCGVCDNACGPEEQCSGGVCSEDCEYPDVDLYDGTEPGGTTMHPTYLGVGWYGWVDDGQLHDGYIDGEPLSTTLAFAFYDDSFTVLCELFYDASISSPQSYTPASGVAPWMSWEVAIADPLSDCPPIDSGLFGTDSAAQFIESLPWGIGIGEMSPELSTALEDAVIASGLDWAADWEPHVVALHAAFDGTYTYEVGYAFNYETAFDDIVLDAKGIASPLPAPEGPPLSDYFEGYGYYVFSLL